MHFQYTYFELQDFLAAMNSNPSAALYRDSFEKVSDFLTKTLSVVHLEATAIFLESNPSPLPPPVKQKVLTGLREKSKQQMLTLLRDEPGFPYLFSALHQFLQSPANNSLSELKEMVKSFNTAFQTPAPIETIAGILTIFISSKLKKSKDEGLFEFQQEVSQIRKKYDFIKKLSTDPKLMALVADLNYPFTKEHLSQLSEEEYSIIVNHKISQLFLLANFRVNELDPSLSRTIASLATQEPINPLDESDKMNIDEIIQLAERAKQNIGLDYLRQLLSILYKSENFKINHLIWALRIANTITCKAPQTLGLFFERLRLNISPFEIAIKESRELYTRARIELTQDVPYAEVYTAYRKSLVEPHLMPTSEALEESIQNFEAVDKHRVNIKLISYSDTGLKHLLNRIMINFGNASTRSEKQELEPYIWAVLLEYLERTTGVSLRCNQIIDAHLILNTNKNRTIAQMKSIGGKTALQALMMAFCALTTGKKQYCIENSVYLAEHNTKLFTPFFKALEINCTCNVSSDEQDSDPLRANSYLGGVVYGTSDVFRVGYLALMERQLDYFNPAEVTFHMANVSPLLEKQGIQLGTLDSGERKYERTRLYHDIWTYIFEASKVQPPTYDLSGFKNYLIEKKYIQPLETFSILNQFKIKQWYDSAVLALSLEKNVHYRIQPSIYDGELAVVIQGAANDVDEWPGGLHQIICARESLLVPEQRKIGAFIQPHQFFNLFSNFFILTNTMGHKPCIDYLIHTYPGTELMELPETRPSKVRYVEPVISHNKNAQYDQLIQDIKLARKAGYPLLLLFKTIKEASYFYGYARLRQEEITLSIEQSTGAINSLTGLGLPGSVVCATFDAGQFDIQPTLEAEINGGLGVLLCSPPENERDILKHFSLTGQQGQNGFYGFRLERGDLIQQVGQCEIDSQKLFEQWIYQLQKQEESDYKIDDRRCSDSNVLFALQKLVYEFKNAALTGLYCEYLGLLQEKMNECYGNHSDFFPEFFKIALEMIQKSGCDLNLLRDLARNTHNSLMLGFIDKIQSSHDIAAASSAGLTFFESGSLSAASHQGKLEAEGRSLR